MPSDNLSLSKTSLAYAKLAATPTDNAWSQVYNAGNLFACLSLSLVIQPDNNPSLPNLGKEILNNLEAEFFTLEEKTLDTIAQAIEKSTTNIPEHVTLSCCLAYFKGATLYLFLKGQGRMLLKRREKIGTLLEQKEAKSALQTASGYLQNGDTILLETQQFAQNISAAHIAEALQLELPNDIAETLSLEMHKNTDGDQAAVIITYHGLGVTDTHTVSPPPNITEQKFTEDAEESEEEVIPAPISESRTPHRQAFSLTSLLDKIPPINLPFFSQKRRIVMGLSHRRKIFLSVTIIIIILLGVSILLTKQQQQSSQTSALFTSVYDPALKRYDEGKSLASLNKEMSQEDLREAERILLEGMNKFPKNSKEAKQLEDLLAKVRAELAPKQEMNENVTEVTPKDTNILFIAKANSASKGFSQDENNVYFVNNDAVFAISKSDGKKKEIVTNESTWEKAISIVPYQGNLYVLDQASGVIKFVGSGANFTESEYFKSSQDVSKAVSMAIDSSLWILLNDGTIKKFTRGEVDNFSVKNLTTPFNKPSRIYTDKDITNIYVLDNGNSRVVKLATDGTFQSEYKASIIKDAKEFEVNEKDKKLFILARDKVWEIAL